MTTKAKEFIVNGTFTFNGMAIVKADNALQARERFESGEFSYLDSTAELVDWESSGVEANE